MYYINNLQAIKKTDTNNDTNNKKSNPTYPQINNILSLFLQS